MRQLISSSLLLYLFLVFLGVTQSNAQGYNIVLPKQCSQITADTMLVLFPNTIPNANGSGILSIIYEGDLDAPTFNEKLDIYDENNLLIGTTTPVVQCTGIDTFNYSMSKILINALALDSVIEFTIIAGSGVAPSCFNGSNYNSFCVTASLYYPQVGVPNDMGVASIDSPSIFCEGLINVVATIENYGSNQVTSCLVNWSVNNVVQSSVTYSGLLDTANGPLSSTSQVTLGSFFFATGVINDLDVWTSLPNAQPDNVSKNDSASAILQPRLSGNFTVDTAGTGVRNYLTINAAITDLNKLGVCGPVTFNVASGIYNEQLEYTSIEYANSFNPITFHADTPVIVQYSATNSMDNYVLKLNGVRWLTLDGFTFQNNSGGSTFKRVVDMGDKSSYNSIKNCIFNMYNSSSTATNLAGFSVTSHGNNFNKFIGNKFYYGGYYGFLFSGTNVGNIFDGNLFEGGYQYGVRIINSSDIVFRNNTILHNSTSTTDGYGLSMENTYGKSGRTEITGNYIDYRYCGIFLERIIGNELTSVIVANNMIHAGLNTGTYTAYGIQLVNRDSEYIKIANNTIWANSGSNNDCYGIYIDHFSWHNDVLNNSIFLPKPNPKGYGIFIYGREGKSQFNYNNVWAPNANYGYYNLSAIPDLSAWQALGYGLNSHTANPGYTKKDSMYTCNDTLDNNGLALEDVVSDFQGDRRHLSLPDIGADEFDGQKYRSWPDIEVCPGDTVEIGTNVTGSAYLWNTNETTPTILVSDPGQYSVSIASSCNGIFTDTIDVVECKTIGIAKKNSNWLISLTPNPVSSMLTIQFENFKQETINMNVFNIQGQQLSSHQFREIGSFHTETLDVSKFTKGVYLMQFHSDNETVVKRFVVN